MENKHRKIHLLVLATLMLPILFVIVLFLYRKSDAYLMSVILKNSGGNMKELRDALDYYKKGTTKYDAMVYLIKNISYHFSVDPVSSNSKSERYDIETITCSFLINNLEKAYTAWMTAPWSSEVDFYRFCNYILPYRVGNEPIVDWREILKNKYEHLVLGVSDQKRAFEKVYSYIINNFKVQDNKNTSELNVLMLDSLQGGNCKERALLMVSVMRALGIAASLDYTPCWANHGKNAHYWTSMILPNHSVYTIGKDSVNYIDGTYEPMKYHFNEENYEYDVDCLKRIAKVYRLRYNIVRTPNTLSVQDIPIYMQNCYAEEVTKEYNNTIREHVLPVKIQRNIPLYVCTFQQSNGWIPIGEAKRLNADSIDIGPVVHDNIVIIATYNNGVVIPLSNPFLVSHNSKPHVFSPKMDSVQSVKLLRKYCVNSRWPNRWGDMIGAVIETSNQEEFSGNTSQMHLVTQMPTEMYIASLNGKCKRFLRFLPANNKYPVIAEIDLINSQGEIISKKDYRIYAVGEGLTGDTIPVGWLRDNNISTTFYKQFPYWIGIELTARNADVSSIQFILWNDQNRITPGHIYELFYFNIGWKSLGQKRAVNSSLEFEKVPQNSVLLLKDYSAGTEERIFVYKDNKQFWW